MSKQTKILVLDDEKSYAQMLHDVLTQRFFDARMVTKPEQALEMLEEDDYGLIVSDFKMPVMDGADFLQKIRSINPGIPVIMVSGLMNLPELIKVANMSITLVLEKPIDVSQFIEHVSRFVKPYSEEAFKQVRSLLPSGGAEEEHKKEENHRNWVYNYPEPKQLSDYSLSSKVFFERLWEATGYHKLVFISTPKGSEIETIARELGSWLGFSGEAPYFLPAKEVIKSVNQELVDKLNAGKEYMPVLAVSQFSQFELSDQEAFMAFCNNGLSSLNGADSLRILCFMEEEVLEQHACLEECKKLFAGRTVNIPPLCSRFSDLAIYIQNYISVYAQEKNLPIKARLSTDVISDLLHYSWPKNFEQLTEILWKLVEKGGDVPIQRSEVRQLLPEMDENSPSLEVFLKQKQTEAINRALITFHGHWSDVGFALGLKGKIPQDGTRAEDLDLLYPELLKATDLKLKT